MEVLTLVIVAGPQAGTAVATLSENELLGRSARKSSLKINDASISEQHAELLWRGDAWRLRDLGSTNGTYVNGRPIERGEGHLLGGEEVSLREGDVLQFGDETVAEVRLSPADPEGLSIERSIELEARRLQDRTRVRKGGEGGRCRGRKGKGVMVEGGETRAAAMSDAQVGGGNRHVDVSDDTGGGCLPICSERRSRSSTRFAHPPRTTLPLLNRRPKGLHMSARVIGTHPLRRSRTHVRHPPPHAHA